MFSFWKLSRLHKSTFLPDIIFTSDGAMSTVFGITGELSTSLFLTEKKQLAEEIKSPSLSRLNQGKTYLSQSCCQNDLIYCDCTLASSTMLWYNTANDIWTDEDDYNTGWHRITIHQSGFFNQISTGTSYSRHI